MEFPDVVAYAVPLDVENLDVLGIARGSGSALAHSLGTLRDATADAGASFVDLHDLLSSAAFTGASHFDTPRPHDGLGRLARALAPEDASASETTQPSLPSAPEPAPSAEAEPATAPAEPDYQQIALTAYAYHRRATTRVRSDEPASSWEAVGRIRELNQRIDRN